MRRAQIPADWPHRAASAIVEAAGVSWHVQTLGAGPAVLMLHGTAASTHSFRALADGLAPTFQVVMVDLPGHGFSGTLSAPTLPRVADALGALLTRLELRPELVVGHSAGAAVAIRMVLDGRMDPQAIVGLAPALKPYGGAAEGFASQLARLTVLNPFAPRLMAWNASPLRVGRLIARTGSDLDDAGAAYYTRLLQNPDHLAGALRLMAHWSLRPLLADLGGLTTPLTLVVGEKDMATRPRDVEHAARYAPSAELIRLAGLGHLAHEEDPEQAAKIIKAAAEGLFAPEPAAAAGGV